MAFVRNIFACVFLAGLSGLGVLPALALNPQLPPGGNFDLSHWYLQLPTSNNILTGASGSVDSASASQLVAGFTNAYFYTGPDGAMTFQVPDSGAHTSGSLHPRSELREELNPADSGLNWNVYGTHIMTAQCRVLQVPSDTLKVCIGQIHEPNNKPDGSASANNEQMIMFDLARQTIYVNINLDGNLSSSFSVTMLSGAAVATNTPINYTVSVVNGLLTIAINNVTNSWDLLSGTNYQGHIAQNWDLASSNTVCFKAGDYNQTTNACGCATDFARVAFYSLTRYHAPAITNQPVGQTVVAGGTASLAVGAVSTGPLSYQWYLNANPVAGATNASLTLPSVTAANIGDYTVVISDSTMGFTSVTSAVATVTGNFAPVINRPPAGQAVLLGGNATFTVAAGGASPLAYQWVFNSVTTLAGATNASLNLTNVQTASLGSYAVVVTNRYGAVTSTPAPLYLNNYVSSTNVVLDARWLDAARTNTALPADSPWYASAAASLVAVTNALQGTPDPAATLNWWTYFTANAAQPVHLNNGDTLRVTLKFTPGGVTSNTSRGLRLGLFNSSPGTRTLADGSLPQGANVAGYMMNNSFSTVFNYNGSGNLQWLVRTNLPDASLVGTVNNYTVLASGGPATGAPGFSNGVPYVLQLSVTRNAGAVNLLATFTSTNSWSATLAATDTSVLTSDFDTFVFRPALQAQTATNFTFSEFKVEQVASSNHPPVPAFHAAVTSPNQPLALAVSNLLATDFDPDGDALAVTAVGALSTNHGAEALAGGAIVYTPPAGYAGTDLFNYTLTDARGAGSTGQVLVSIIAPPAVTNLSLSSDQSAFSLSGTGLAGRAYVLMTTPSLIPPAVWTPVATSTADAGGGFILAGVQATNAPKRFYRVASP
jgi:Alginate lyase/Bacterial Ig domain